MKRVFDLLMVVIFAPLWVPLLLIVALLIAVFQGRPVLFVQERAGRHAQPFNLFKFRTMSERRDAAGDLLPDDERLTRIGAFVRSTSLDELPQLINVALGQMSLVGPRPLYMRYVPLYGPRQATRLRALPGVTGWAQIKGRNAISWEEKFELDAWYVEQASMKLDFLILLRTVRTVLWRRGIGHGASATIHEFTGSELPAAVQTSNETPTSAALRSGHEKY